MKAYHVQNIMVFLLGLIPVIYLLKRIWSYKQLKRSIKWNWTWAMVLTSWVSVPIYVWAMDSLYIIKESR